MKLSLLSLLMICGLAFNIKAEKTPVYGKRQPLSGQVESIPGDLTGPRYRQSLVALATLDASSGQVITAYNSGTSSEPMYFSLSLGSRRDICASKSLKS